MHIEQPVTAYIGLGANLGQAPHTLRSAFEALANSPDVSLIQASSLYESAPVDAPGPIYTNAVVEIHTTLKAQALLDTIQNIEHQFGRER